MGTPSTLARRALITSVLLMAAALVAAAPAPAWPGEPDAGFGTDGTKVIHLPFDGFGQSPRGLAWPGGRLVVGFDTGGFMQPDGPQPPGGWALMRLRPDGQLDRSFGRGGVELLRAPGGALSLTRDGQGRLVAGGADEALAADHSTYVATAAVRRFDADGNPDTTFGMHGVATLPQFYDGAVVAIRVRSDGRIMVAITDDRMLSTARLLPDGGLDPSYGVGGVVTTSVPSGAYGPVASAAIGPDGTVVLAGIDRTQHPPVVALARVRADGTLDPGLAAGGLVRLGHGEPHVNAVRLGLDSLGRPIVGVGVTQRRRYSWQVTRLLGNGSPDPAFGVRGWLSAALIRLPSDDQLTVQADGSILTAANDVPRLSLVFCRYTPAGATDLGFGQRGCTRVAYGDPRQPSKVRDAPGFLDDLVDTPRGAVLLGEVYDSPITHVFATRFDAGPSDLRAPRLRTHVSWHSGPVRVRLLADEECVVRGSVTLRRDGARVRRWSLAKETLAAMSPKRLVLALGRRARRRLAWRGRRPRFVLRVRLTAVDPVGNRRPVRRTTTF